MKSREVTNGMECYYHPSNTWAESMRRGSRAVVVNACPGNWFLNRHTKEWELNRTRGQEVLVDLYESTDTWGSPVTPSTPTRRPVTLASLRGPWEETHREHERLIQMMQAADLEESDRRQRARAQCDRAVELLAKLGIKATAGNYYSNTPNLIVQGEGVVQLAEAAQQLNDIGWNARTE